MFRFLKFAGSSLVGGTVDMVLIWFLCGYIFDGYWGDVVISPIISFECSVIVGFTFCWFFVWNDRVESKEVNTDYLSDFLKRLLAYNISNIGIFLLRLGLVVLIEKCIGEMVNLVIINLVARMVAGLLNFIISDKLIFRKR